MEKAFEKLFWLGLGIVFIYACLYIKKLLFEIQEKESIYVTTKKEKEIHKEFIETWKKGQNE